MRNVFVNLILSINFFWDVYRSSEFHIWNFLAFQIKYTINYNTLQLLYSQVYENEDILKITFDQILQIIKSEHLGANKETASILLYYCVLKLNIFFCVYFCKFSDCCKHDILNFILVTIYNYVWIVNRYINL